MLGMGVNVDAAPLVGTLTAVADRAFRSSPADAVWGAEALAGVPLHAAKVHPALQLDVNEAIASAEALLVQQTEAVRPALCHPLIPVPFGLGCLP